MSSLKRDEYIEMWNALMRLIPRIDGCNDPTCLVCKENKKAIKIIKDKIQKVIGQME